MIFIQLTIALTAAIVAMNLDVSSAFLASSSTLSPSFSIQRYHGGRSAHLYLYNTVSSPCTIAEDNHDKIDFVSQPGSGQILRSALLTNADGEKVKLGQVMGDGTSIVIFLRHLGCVYCWNYANDWCKLQQTITSSSNKQLGNTNVRGPLFVSIGDREKLNTFLNLNPDIPRDNVFVDDYNFHAYNAVGFGNFTDISDADKKDIRVRKPNLSFRTWWKYLTNVIQLSPIVKGTTGIPEGVLRLGGTFVVQGDNVVYQWNDKIPGDHPEPRDVLAFVERLQKDNSVTSRQLVERL